MKKIISLLLCLVMLALTLASCGDNAGTTTTDVDRPNLTLKIAVVVSDKTTDDGIAAMQKEFNRISSLALTTKAEFVCFRAEEYADAIEVEMARLESSGELADIEDENDKANGTGDKATVDADGFPIAESKQFDLVLITGEEMYTKFAEKGWIISLQSYLDGIFQKLKTKVLDQAMAATLIDGHCYAIPTAKAYGEYTYLSVNKKVADFYNINASDITDLNSAYQIFKAMEIAPDGEGLEKCMGMYSSFSPVLNDIDSFVYPSVKYFSIDGDFSLIGSTYLPDDKRGTWYDAENRLSLLEDARYKKYLTMKFDFANKGYFGEGTEEDYVIGIVNGDYSLRNSDPENYYYIPIQAPTVEREEVFETMLAVSSFSVNAKRAVEMLQELMTNDTKSNLLNIILYGAVNENYYLENGTVKLRESHNYAAHPDFMYGNLNETAYPCSNYGQTETTYSDALLQNLDLPDPKFPVLFDDELIAKNLYFFTRPAGWEEWEEGDPMPAGSEKVPDEVLRSIAWAKVNAFSKMVMEELMSSDTMEEFISKYDAIVAEMNNPDTTNEDVRNFITVKGGNLVSDDRNTITYGIASYLREQ